MTGHSITVPTQHRAAILAAIEAQDVGEIRRRFADWAFEITGGAVRDRVAPGGVAVLELMPGRTITRDHAIRLLAGLERLEGKADPSEIVQLATQCLTVTASRERGEIETAALIAALADDLAGYPRDIVADAFRQWRRKSKFWPTPAEIVALCDAANAWRRGLRAMCERAIAAPADDAPIIPYRDLPAERKAALDAKIAAAFESLKADRPAAPAVTLPDVTVPMPRATAAQPDEAPEWPV